jgi:hypothetical protein
MNVLDVLDEIPFIPDLMLPKAALPHRLLLLLLPGGEGGSRYAGSQPWLKVLLMSRQRLEKWSSPSGKVQRQCR